MKPKKHTDQTNMIKNVVERYRHSPVPIYSSRKNVYPELYLFKNQIEVEGNTPSQSLFTIAKSKVLLYRTIFLSLGVLYFLLAIVLFTKSLTWTCSVIFGNCFLIKSLLCSLSSFSAIYCLVVGFLFNAEREVVKKIFAGAKKRLSRAYERKAVECGKSGFFTSDEENKNLHALKEIYLEALEKLQDYKEDALHIFKRIAKTSTLERGDKEKLFNQAAMECRDRMDLVVQSFKSTSLPKFAR